MDTNFFLTGTNYRAITFDMNLILDQSSTKKIARRNLAKALLGMHRIRSRDLARQIGVHESLICHVLSGRGKSRRVQQAIADVLNMSFEELWG